MATLRCPKCGKNNPDLLDVCQFCQTPLKKDSGLQAPTKKNTGELEAILPDWLKNVRQQAKDSAEQESPQMPAPPKVEKEEPPDLLAGLVSQSDAGEDEEIPDWLASISPPASPKPAASPSPAGKAPSAPEPEADFFAQFNRSEPAPASPPPQEPAPFVPEGRAEQPSDSAEDELSKWFAQAAEQPEEIFEVDPETGTPGDAAWVSPFASASAQEQAPQEAEDLSWLHNLEAASKETGELQAPKSGTEWAADFETPAASSGTASGEDLSWLDNLGGVEETQPSAQGEDLSWLNNLSAISEPQPFDAAPDKPISGPSFDAKEDLDWLNNLGSASEPESPAPAQPVSMPPFEAKEDLSWLNNLGGAADEPEPPAPAQPASAPPFVSGEDLSWLNNLGQASEPEQPASRAPASAAEDLSWLNTLGGEAAPPSTPPFVQTGQLRDLQETPSGKPEAEPPDWLKSAMEAPAPAQPSLDDVSLDWFKNQEQPAQEASAPVPDTPQPAPFSDIFASLGEPTPAANQDVDSLFSVEMPDWLSGSEPAAAGASAASQPELPPPAEEDSLAPVDLPSWVQAMRPVEAVISETSSSAEEGPEETQGPLAGLRGVIPGLPISASMRPKAISLKLLATDEQQASAALLDQILGSETSARPLTAPSFVASQQVLRRVLAGLFLLVLSAVIFFRSQTMPVSNTLPEDVSGITGALMNVPANSKVLVVIDYEPSLAGEMEAAAGPLLDHMVVLGRPQFSFVSTSPNGPFLAERLLTNTKITKPNIPDNGFEYQAGTEYCNLGFLPGGSVGVLGFIKSPSLTLPASCEAAGTGAFSDYRVVILMTDHAEAGRVWVEQLQAQKQLDPALASQPLFVVASAQAAPLLQPYVSSQQIAGMISGLADAVRYEESQQGVLPFRTARPYWDAFGAGLMMAVALIVIGSLWSLFTGIRARRAAEQG